MAVNRVAGHPNYETGGPNQNIAWLFSKKAIAKFYDSTVLSAILNADADLAGIQGLGSKVIFNTIPSVNIKDYAKGDVVNFENLESPSVELDINKAKMFAFKMDKIDIKQFTTDMMSELAKDAAEQMKISIDTDALGTIFADAAAANKGLTAGLKSLSVNLGTTGSSVALTKVNILDMLVDMAVVADEQSWPEDGRWIVMPPTFTGLIKKSDLKDASLSGDPKSILRNGKVGEIDRWHIYNSNLLTGVSDTGNTSYNIMFGHKSAGVFASQLTETEYFDKLETTFGKGMKGLNVYGYKITKPSSLGVLYAHKG